MSPTGSAFQNSVNAVLNDISHSIGICHRIRETRRLGSRHENFDNLLKYLCTSHTSLSTKYDTLQECFGRRIEIGDGLSVTAMENCLRAVSSDVKRKLHEISVKTDGNPGTRHLPGFRALLQHWKDIEEDASNIIIALSRRLIILPPTSNLIPSPTSSLRQEPEIRSDQQIVSKSDFEFLVQHMENSWTETWSDGQLIYVNYFNPTTKTTEKPDAFIKAASVSY